MNPSLFVLAGRFILYMAIIVMPVANAPLTNDTLEIKTHLFRLLGAAAAILYMAIAVARVRSHPAGAASESKTTRRAAPLSPDVVPPPSPAPYLPDSVDLALLMSVVVLVCSYFFSESVLASVPGAVDAAASLAFFALARSVFGRPAGESPCGPSPAIVAVGISAILPAIFYLCDYYHMGIPDSLGNQNIVSHYLLLSMAAPVYLVLRPGNTRAAGLALGLFLLWVNWLTAARGAVVGALAGLFIVVVLTTVRFWRGISPSKKMWLIVVCLTAFLAAPILLYTYATSTDFNVSIRFLSWKYSISLLNDRFWFGFGPGLFSTSFEKTKLWMTDPDSSLLGLLTVNYAHNDYVELAVEQGVMGLAAFLFLALTCLAPAAKLWAKSPEPRNISDDQARSIAVLFSVVAGLSQAFFDFPFHTPAPRLLFFALMGIAASRLEAADRAELPATAVTWTKAAFAGIACCLPAVPLLSMYSASAIAHVADPQFKAGRYESVMHLHDWASKQDPTRSQYLFRKGLGEEQKRDFDAARSSFRNALALQPYFPNIYFHLGVISLENDPPRASASLYANLAFAAAPVAFHNLAAMCLSMGDSASATAIYREIARRFPDDERAKHNVQALEYQRRRERPPAFLRALEFYQRSRLDLALPLAEQYVADRPDDLEGIFLLGRILFHQGKYAQSERLFASYVAAQADDPEVHYYLGNALYFQNRYRESLGSFIKAAKLNPASPKILYNLGVNYFFVSDARSMNDCFDTVIAINPNVSFKDKMEELRQTVRGQRAP